MDDVEGNGPGPAGRRVLCAVDDPDLRVRLVALCEQQGTPVDVVTARPGGAVWARAGLVLVDRTAAARLEDLPRRRGVVLVHEGVGSQEPAPAVWRQAVATGAEQVVVLPDGLGWLLAAARRVGRPRGRCVAVVGARGGAGATAAAVALATAAAPRRRVLLVDLDPLSGGLDLALGAEGLPGLRWADLHDVRSPLPPGGLAAALPVADGVSVLSYGRSGPPLGTSPVRTVVEAGLDEFDLVVLDLPRAGDEAAEQVAREADLLVCTCPAEVRAVAAAPSVLQRWGGTSRTRVLLRGPVAGGMRTADAAAALRAAAPGAGVLAAVDVVRPEPGLAQALERGEPFAVQARSPLRRWALRLLGELERAGEHDAA